ncbi:MAG: beta-glucosidase [Clostridiaceae bacterium]|nr:beta-glucosidase [Clostridiaceae bacterium]
MEVYKDSNQPIEKRVEDLLSKMTLEEKAAQLCGNLPFSCVEKRSVNVEKLRELFPHGHGRFTQYSLTGLTDPEMIAQISNDIQRYFVEETRLGIPVVFQSENLCGYPGAGGTLFPAMINLGSTWEPELAHEMSRIIGRESRAVGITSAMSPVIDIARDPRWGRVYETYGEDPYLVTQMGIEYIKGMQGDKKNGVACIAKHFLGYSETQGGLNCAAARINKRELYEMFATPFEAADKVAEVSAMMANYGEIDGIPVGANKEIARELLRDIMGFKGMLTSDGAAIMKMWNYFHIAQTYEEAGLLAKKGGLDTEIPVGGAYAKLPEYVRNGQLEEELLDESVRRILTIKFAYGLFENPYVEVKAARKYMRTPETQALSEKIAEKSLIMIKNNGVLPLKKGTKLAVIGPHADNLRYPVSGYTYPSYIEIMDTPSESENVTFQGMADEAAVAKKEGKNINPFASAMNMYKDGELSALGGMETILRNMGTRTLNEVLSDRFETVYAEGCDIIAHQKDGFEEAINAARESDVVIMALGGNCGWVNVTGGEGKDRCHLDLPGVQHELLEAVAAVGKPVIVILYGPGIFKLNWASEHVDAIVQAWMPGPSAGKVVTDLLDGTINPGGKLTVSIPRCEGQIPLYYNQKVGSSYIKNDDGGYANIIFSGGYVDEDASPLYPFGFGLSYTTFELGNFSVQEKVPTDGTIHVRCTIKNTGDRAGSEVVQLYTHFKGAHVTRPNKQLSAFKRIELAPQEQRTIDFYVDCAQLGYYNEDMEFVVEPGPMDIMLGTSAHDLPFIHQIDLIGEKISVMGKRSYTSTVTIN